jgi:hypothetical protein
MQKQQNNVSAAAATLAKARKRSGSIAGSPTGAAVGNKQKPNTRREQLAQAWADSEEG